MHVRDIMTSPAITITPDATVVDIAKLLIEKRISAMPVVDNTGKIVGMVSEGDLIRRAETDTERRPSWWLSLFGDTADLARHFAQAHGRTAADVMTRPVKSVTEDADLADVAEMLERERIKRVPVVRDGEVVGIVSRANLLQALATAGPRRLETPTDEQALRFVIETALADAGLSAPWINVTVVSGNVHLWGAVESADEKQAVRIAAQEAAGAAKVIDHVGILPPIVRSTLWAE